MTSTFVLRTDRDRAFAIQAVQRAELGKAVVIREPTRTLDQNAALHAAITDISKQVTWHGQKFSVLTWKRLCMAAWLREEGEQPELIPALDGKGFDVVYEHTSQLNKTQFSALLEWTYRFGAEHDVQFQTREEPPARTEER